MSFTTQHSSNNNYNTNGNATSEADKRKLFVGGLSWETTVEDLKSYFSKYGKVEEASVKSDPATGRPRGFGFVFFEEAESAEKAVAERSHSLNGKAIDPKRAMVNGGKGVCRKIFVGGIDGNVEEAAIRSYFQNFGKVEQVDLPYDKIRNSRRNFCFVTFDSEDACDSACATMRQMIAGKEVDVKKATPAAAQAARARIQNTYGQSPWSQNMTQSWNGMQMQYPGQFPSWNSNFPTFTQPQTAAFDFSAYYGQPGQVMPQTGQLWPQQQQSLPNSFNGYIAQNQPTQAKSDVDNRGPDNFQKVQGTQNQQYNEFHPYRR